MESEESVCKILNVDINGMVVYVVVLCFLNGVMVDVNDFVEVVDYDLSDFMKFFEVEVSIIVVDECRES